MGNWVDHRKMVINMNESKLTTIAQIEQFLAATPEIEFTGVSDAGDVERYAHISRVLKRFDYPRRSKRARSILAAPANNTAGSGVYAGAKLILLNVTTVTDLLSI